MIVLLILHCFVYNASKKNPFRRKKHFNPKKGWCWAALFVASNVPKQDVPTTNGVLHILDQVVTPKLWRFPERNFMQFANKADQPGQRDRGLWSGNALHT